MVGDGVVCCPRLQTRGCPTQRRRNAIGGVEFCQPVMDWNWKAGMTEDQLERVAALEAGNMKCICNGPVVTCTSCK